MKNLTLESLKVFEQVTGKNADNLDEAVGDNRVDNLINDLAIVTEVEMEMFVSQMLVQNASKFLFHYNMPAYEDFKTSFKDVIARYIVMGSEEKGDLFAKIENMFKEIFMQKYAAMGPEVASVTATVYATQMIRILKSNSVQANTDMYGRQGPI